MKRISYSIFMLLIIQQLSAQQPLPTGTYKVDLNKTLALMEGEVKQKYEALDDQAKQRAGASMAGRVFIFRENGQIEVRWNANGTERTTTGNWELKGDDELQIKMGEQVTEYSISHPTQTRLILRNSKGRGLFNNLYLERAE